MRRPMRMQRSSAATPWPRRGTKAASTSSSATRRTSRSSPRPRVVAARVPTAADRTPTPPSSSSPSPYASPAPSVAAWVSSSRSRSSPRAMPRRSAPTSIAWPRSRGRGGRHARSSTPRSSCAHSSSNGACETSTSPARPWTEIVTGRLGVPPLPTLSTSGTLGDRARLSANFRDQYYGLVPAVVEGGDGPALVTSGLVDPGRCAWGQRPVTFAKRRFARPTVDLARLSAPMRRWAETMLVPKVVVANQTRVIEAVSGLGRDVDPRRPAHLGPPERVDRRPHPRRAPDLAGRQRMGVAPSGRAPGCRPAPSASARAGSPSCHGRRAVSPRPPQRSPLVTSTGAATRSPRRTDSIRTIRSSPVLGRWWRGWLPS